MVPKYRVRIASPGVQKLGVVAKIIFDFIIGAFDLLLS